MVDILYIAEKEISNMSAKCKLRIKDGELSVDVSECGCEVSYKLLGFASAKITRRDGGDVVELWNCSEEKALQLVEEGMYTNAYNEKECLNIGCFSI